MRNMVLAFVAGFIAVLVFHQGMVEILQAQGVRTVRAFPSSTTWPFGLPRIWSLAFWGGVWGILLLVAQGHRRFPSGNAYWLGALVFGAVFPTLVATLVVAPLRGQGFGGVLDPGGVLTGMAVNGAWGLGTAILLSMFRNSGGRLAPGR